LVHRQRDKSEPLPVRDEPIGVLEPESVRGIGQEDHRVVTSQEAVDGVFDADVGRDAADDDHELGVERFLEAGKVFVCARGAGKYRDWCF
jgi:hypothetical protein